MQSVAAVVESFRQKVLKITPQRRFIFQALADNHGHPTAEEIYQYIVSVLPDVSRTTVYNTLRELITLGELVEIHLGEGKTRYDINTGPHHHLHCVSCHTLVDIHRDFGGLELLTEERAGYHIVGRRVTFYGNCPSCQVE
jgi:Fe2+ or Zn2+ uptake regulation protein